MLIYIPPAMMDWLLFFVFFAVFYSAGKHGLGTAKCALLGILFQVGYMVFSLAVGHWLNRRNAKPVLIASTVLCGAASVLGLCSTSITWLAAAMLILGSGAAFFFNSFQTFMRGEAAPGELKYSVAMYTLSWSSGAALGNLTAGSLYDGGLLAMNSAVAVVMLVAIVLFARHREKDAAVLSADEHVEQGSAAARPVCASYVVVGWIIIFTAMFVQRPVFTFLPPIFAKDGVSAFVSSLPLSAHMAVQALVGLGMIRFRDLLYRRTPFWIVHVLAAAAFIGIWLWPSYPVCFAMLIFLGAYAGFAYFSAVYYASNSGRRSFNIGLNEAFVGLGSIAGIVAGEWWMNASKSEAGMYLVCAGCLILSTLAQLAFATARAGSSKA